jgi:hypothetical protein
MFLYFHVDDFLRLLTRIAMGEFSEGNDARIMISMVEDYLEAHLLFTFLFLYRH